MPNCTKKLFPNRWTALRALTTMQVRCVQRGSKVPVGVYPCPARCAAKAGTPLLSEAVWCALIIRHLADLPIPRSDEAQGQR